MDQIFLRDAGLGSGPCGFDFLRPALGDELLVARQKLLDLDRVIGERFSRGIDRRQAAADDNDRQAHLHVGHRIHTRGAGELQRHQEIRRGANAVGEPVRKLEHRRPPGAGRQCNVIEPEREGAFGIDRAAETHAAKQREALAALDQQSNDLEEVLIPAHRDAILGDAAKAGHHARFERLVERGDIPDGVEGHAVAQRGFSGQRRRQWLDFQSIDADYRVSVVEKMVRERKSRRTHADHQHPLAGRLCRYRTPEIERIPAREQAVQLESPRQRQHILQRARLRLRNVDRFLLLVNARFHAIVANAMTGGGDHRVIDADHRQRADRPAFGAELVKLRDFFFERTAGQYHAERGFLERWIGSIGGLFFVQAR